MRFREAAVLAAVALAAGCGGTEKGPTGPQLDVRLGLARDQTALEKSAFALNDPGSPRYGRFLTLDAIASRFGASGKVRDQVLAFLGEQGLKARVDATGGVVLAPMTTKQATDLFHVRFARRKLEDGSTTIEPRGSPRIPHELQGLVTEVVGLARSKQPPPTGEAPRPKFDQAACTTAKERSKAILDRYGISTLAGRGLRGQGMTLAVTAVDAIDRPALEVWARCLGVTAPPVQGTGRSAEVVHLGSDHELELDLDTVVAAAPRLAALETIVFDPVEWAGEPYRVALEREDGPPDVISSSETYCEQALTEGDRNLTEWVLAAADAAGVTVVVASGDSGSSGCAPQDKRLAVQYPASSPFVTAVGGTELAGGREAVWSDRTSVQAGGGGVSASAPLPPYQHAKGGHRALPDVAYTADPGAWPAIPVCNRSECTWTAIGGTSASAPLFGAGVALVKQLVRRAGKVPPGLLNPLLYRDAPQAADDVITGSNDLYGTGCCTALPGFDTASGWGFFDFARLAALARSAAPRTA